MKYYTRTGDGGETSLMYGIRVPKDDEVIEALGDIDELSSVIGLVIANIKDEKIKDVLYSVQKSLYFIGAEISDPYSKTILLEEKDVSFLEKIIDELQDKIPAIKHFIAPGGSLASCYLHLARSVCRRAERSVVRLSKKKNLNKNIIPYLNRLSSLFFVLALYYNKIEGYKEIEFELKK